MTHNYDVAVIGAGIAGTVIAKSLADQGWNTIVFDRKKFPRHKVCGEFLSPESRSMLTKFGLREGVEDLQPCPIHQARIILSSGKPLEVPLPGTAWGVSRYQLDAALHQAAVSSGVHVRTETTVTSVKPSDKGYLIGTKQNGDNHFCEVRAVIAACGANGLSALQSQHRRESEPAHIGVKSHFQGIEMERVVELYFFKGGYLGIAPIEGGLVNAAALLDRKSFQHTEKSVLGFIEAACRRNPKLSKRLASALPIDGTQAAVAPLQLSRKPLAWDMFPLLGDASLMIPPLCGDGMSMALRSAGLCAPLVSSYLKKEITLAEWEQRYTQAIYREFKGPLQWGHFLQGLLEVPFLPHVLLAAARFTPGLANRFVQATRLKETEF